MRLGHVKNIYQKGLDIFQIYYIYISHFFCTVEWQYMINKCFVLFSVVGYWLHVTEIIAYNELLPFKCCHLLITFIAHFCPWLDGIIQKTFFLNVNQILQWSLQHLYQESSAMLTSKEGLIFVVNLSTWRCLLCCVISEVWPIYWLNCKKFIALAVLQLALLCWDEYLYKYDVQMTERILKLGHKMTYWYA